MNYKGQSNENEADCIMSRAWRLAMQVGLRMTYNLEEGGESKRNQKIYCAVPK